MKNTLPKDVQDFIDSIKNVPFFKIQCRPKPEWKLFISSSWDAAYNAAYNAAHNAAYTAAYGAAHNAAYDAAHDTAYTAAYGAAHTAARDAAYTAARGAARDAAYTAARDAALVAICLLAKDKINPKHLKYAFARWEIWEMGYGVTADVDGVFYVYAKMNGIERAIGKVK